tara:strand:- start:229 stop:975 length:747 start_codon:yes stop_codon:yes gene_type:complete
VLIASFDFSCYLAMSLALASQLREGTKKAHTMAENTGFVSCFLKGVVDKATYRKLVVDLYFVYFAMEEEIERLTLAGHPVVSRISYPELNRREALEKDLRFYFGSDWANYLKPTSSAEAYVARIHKVAKQTPELLIGHHYTRYIGDLSGGQILKNIAQKAMNLPAHDGLRFYEFDKIQDEKIFKSQYSQNLDSLPINQSMVDLIVQEANHAFQWNMEIFQELEGNLIAAIGKVLFGFLTRRKRQGSTE